MIERRKNSPLEATAFNVRPRHIMQERIPIFHHMSVAVDDGYSIACHFSSSCDFRQ